ncbi:MAG: Ig-like domain-containing protein [Bacteroidota bacterium]|nr:Ig-like domain-containing protein [Bacteroidota bacterium]
MKRTFLILILLQVFVFLNGQIIDHNCIRLQNIPQSYIDLARSKLHIVYEHTSHGSQLIDGMTGLYNWKGSAYAWNNGGINGALDLHDHGITGGSDLGSPDWTSWAASTRTCLRNPANSNINIVMWAWCSQVSTATQSNINTYLSLMSSLEAEFPNVKFVYMTGHLDGTGVNGTLNIRNEQIRAYCKTNNKILYDFADIESYDPDGNYYLDKRANDNCDYDSNGDNIQDKNWAVIWQTNHVINVDWYYCPSAHSKPLNANMKAYAAWWLFARLAGWGGPVVNIPVTGITVSGSGNLSEITTDNGTLQLTASVLPSNATNQGVTWSISAGAGKAAISSSGLVTALANGTVTAKASSNDGSGIYGTLEITISNQYIPVETISITSTGGLSIITSENGTLQLTANITPESATNKSIIWSVMNGTGEASISADGVLTAEKNGIVTVRATAADGTGISATIEITIVNQLIPVEKISVSTETGLNFIPEDDGTLRLTASVSPEIATVKAVTWSVRDITGRASVDQAGMVTAITEGLISVTATANDGTGVQGSIAINIKGKRSDPLVAIVTQSEIKIPLVENYIKSRLSLYDLNGNLIESMIVDGDLCIFSTGSLRPGIYILMLSDSFILKTGKVIIPGGL